MSLDLGASPRVEHRYDALKECGFSPFVVVSMSLERAVLGPKLVVLL
jgi:hypothetical protein